MSSVAITTICLYTLLFGVVLGMVYPELIEPYEKRLRNTLQLLWIRFNMYTLRVCIKMTRSSLKRDAMKARIVRYKFCLKYLANRSEETK